MDVLEHKHTYKGCKLDRYFRSQHKGFDVIVYLFDCKRDLMAQPILRYPDSRVDELGEVKAFEEAVDKYLETGDMADTWCV